MRSRAVGCAAERVYAPLKAGLYGLHSILLCLFIVALLRIKSIEGLSAHQPGERGLLLGLDRVPEVETLRRKLEELGEQCREAKLAAVLPPGAGAGVLFAGNFGGVLRLVRPLCYLPEKDLLHFARACGFPPAPPECPRGGHSQREVARDLLRRVPKEYRNVRANLLRAGLRGGD